jgi:hypothetical protein
LMIAGTVPREAIFTINWTVRATFCESELIFIGGRVGEVHQGHYANAATSPP